MSPSGLQTEREVHFLCGFVTLPVMKPAVMHGHGRNNPPWEMSGFESALVALSHPLQESS